jgi:phosphatidylglycerol:prolipoprotein diacylglycerol transferase
MLPLLFSIGPINFYTFAFFLAIGFFLSSFLIWRRLRDLGIDEEKIIDLILLASLVGLVFSRIFFIVQNLSLLGFKPDHWLLINQYPGFSFWGGMGGVLLTVFGFSRKENLDAWQVIDEFVYGLMPLLVLVQIGAFFDGSGFGKPTTMPWGIYVVGSLVKRQPLPLVMALAFLILWFFLIRIERHWRTWEWYQSKAYGLVTLLFVLIVMLINFLVAFWREGLLYWHWLEIGLSLIFAILTIIMIYLRSERRTFGKTKEKKS